MRFGIPLPTAAPVHSTAVELANMVTHIIIIASATSGTDPPPDVIPGQLTYKAPPQLDRHQLHRRETPPAVTSLQREGGSLGTSRGTERHLRPLKTQIGRFEPITAERRGTLIVLSAKRESRIFTKSVNRIRCYPIPT